MNSLYDVLLYILGPACVLTLIVTVALVVVDISQERSWSWVKGGCVLLAAESVVLFVALIPLGVAVMQTPKEQTTAGVIGVLRCPDGNVMVWNKDTGFGCEMLTESQIERRQGMINRALEER